MITAFGTPFLLQERTLYGISDYQTGRCLSAYARRDHDRHRMTSWMAMYIKLYLIYQYNRIFQASVHGDVDERGTLGIAHRLRTHVRLCMLCIPTHRCIHLKLQGYPPSPS